MKSSSLLLLLAGVAICLSSCVTNRSREYLPAATVEFLDLDGDCLEPVNRTMQEVTAVSEKYILSPVDRIWLTVMPATARTGIAHFFENLSFPKRFIGHLLCGDFGYCWTDLQRFAVNSTLGCIGFRDVATGMNLPHIDGGFKETFAAWGIGRGAQMNLPVVGPDSLRNYAGAGVDLLCNPLRWTLPPAGSYSASGVRVVNQTSELLPLYDEIFGTRGIHYEYTRLTSLIFTEASYAGYATDYSRKDYDPDDTMGYVRMTPKDKTFFSEVRQHEAPLLTGGKMPYSSWPLKGAKRLVIILPGIGGHRNNSGVWALAELYRQHGCAVIAVSSTFTPDYFEHTGSDAPSGYLPEDAKRLAAVIDAVAGDFLQRYGDSCAAETAIVGYSLGGLNALHLAALEKKSEPSSPLFHRVRICRYVSVNAPVDSLKALDTIDTCFDTPMQWPENERIPRLRDLRLRLSAQVNPDIRNPRGEVAPFTRDESRFLIGVSLRLALVETLQAQQRINNTGILQEDPEAFFFRNNLFAECLGFGYSRYVRQVLLPYYQQHGLAGSSLESLSAQCNLRALTAQLAADSRIRVLHNRNDLLMNAEDVQWYQDTFGDRLLLFDRGGHLGNMANPAYQEALVKATILKP